MLQQQLFQNGTITINYADSHTPGVPLVLLHGGSGRWQHLESIIPKLAECWHVYALDLRGHGQSSHTPGNYRIQDYAGDIAAFVENVVGQPALVFGHSLGGYVGIMLAAQRPDLLRVLIVGDSPLSREHLRSILENGSDQNTVWRDLAASDLSTATMIEKLQGVHVPSRDGNLVRMVDLYGADNPWFPYMAETLAQHDPDMLTSVMERFDDTFAMYDTDSLLPQIACPVMILQADPDHGGMLTDAEVAHALPLITHPHHIRLSNIGHPLFYPDPQPALDAMIAYLNSQTW
ncbi:MAG: alpha/beta hydrolase [Chloroflexota bacterium]